MIILFSPSETKCEGGQENFSLSTLLGAHLQQREVMIEKYNEFVNEADNDTLEHFFETADIEKRELYTTPLEKRKSLKAIMRYSGVAYDHLDFGSLLPPQQEYLEHSMIIFSNLFGPLMASDMICDYRFRQGAKIPDVAWEKGYKIGFSSYLDQLCENKMVVDLRAGFYEKFYNPSHPTLSFVFKKGGKVVSHWAKAYRGETARLLAIHQPRTQREIMALPWKNVDSVTVDESNPLRTIITVNI